MPDIRETLFETTIEDLRVRVVSLSDDGLISIEYRERLSLIWIDYFLATDPPRELLAPLLIQLIHKAKCREKECDYAR